MLVDSHCHLDFLEDEEELDAVVARARAAGVQRMVTISTKLSTFPKVRAIAERYPEVFCSVGVHPHEAGREGLRDASELLRLAAHEKVVAIGETGLDYYYDHGPREAQQLSFRAHIAAARETGLPLIVHARDADPDCIAILKAEHQAGAYPGVIHCFTAGPELAAAALEIGFSISLAGIVTFKNAQALRDTIAAVPLERLLIETDSPYLAPVPMRGRRNEPAFVAHTARFLAAERGISEDALIDATGENFLRLFSKVT